MLNLAQRIAGCRVPEGQVAVFWLGQAGFLFKTADGTTAAVDLYLSDCCERYFGFKRLMPSLLDAGDVMLDLFIVTHAHYDHFDVDAVPSLLANGHTRLFAALDARVECERLHLNEERITYLKTGGSASYHGVRIQAVPCDHGELAPDALGYLLSVSGKKIYITGDTAYRPDFFEDSALHNADLLIEPINGAFGNMNETQAAQAASILTPKKAVPCHFWNFAEHGGDPNKFAEAMKRQSPAIPYNLMQVGGMMLI